jgi:hypothetical protein
MHTIVILDFLSVVFFTLLVALNAITLWTTTLIDHEKLPTTFQFNLMSVKMKSLRISGRRFQNTVCFTIFT